MQGPQDEEEGAGGRPLRPHILGGCQDFWGRGEGCLGPSRWPHLPVDIRPEVGAQHVHRLHAAPVLQPHGPLPQHLPAAPVLARPGGVRPGHLPEHLPQVNPLPLPVPGGPALRFNYGRWAGRPVGLLSQRAAGPSVKRGHAPTLPATGARAHRPSPSPGL